MQAFREWFLEQMSMYAAYHRDWRNQATHHFGVPLIVFSLVLALTQAQLGYVAGVNVSAATVVLGLMLAGYIVAVPLVGFIAALFYMVLYGVAVTVATDFAPMIWVISASCFVGGWVIQFVGHVFEGRKPALTVNAIQIFMAPPFLIAEILFAIGAGKLLQDQIQSRAVKYLP